MNKCKRKWHSVIICFSCFFCFLLASRDVAAQKQDSLTFQTKILCSQNMHRWRIPSGEYSGITALGDGMYAVVSDKFPGFMIWSVEQDSVTGKVLRVEQITRMAVPDSLACRVRDVEDIAWCPDQEFLVLASEGHQTVLPFKIDGSPYPVSWDIPRMYSADNIYPNYGFESLAYDRLHKCFWTCPENVLRNHAKVGVSDRIPAVLPFLKIEKGKQVTLSGYYRTEIPEAVRRPRLYAFGVSACLSLPEYGLLVLEREFYVSRAYLRSWVNHKIYRVNPGVMDADSCLIKTPVAQFRTHLHPFNYRLANFEGMAQGIRLKDGRQSLLLISDSQGGAGNRLFRLKDFIKVLVLSFGQ